MFPSNTYSADHIPNEETFSEEMFPSNTDSADHIPNEETFSEEMFPSNTDSVDHIPRKETCSTNQDIGHTNDAPSETLLSKIKTQIEELI